MTDYLKKVLENIPADWLKLTTHRLDIYNEKEAKTGFLDAFDNLYRKGDHSLNSLSELPTAYDYIRLGHPLSCLLEWVIAERNGVPVENVISFSSIMMPILAILRKNTLDGKKTRIVYSAELPEGLTADALKRVYGYDFKLVGIEQFEELAAFDGSTIQITSGKEIGAFGVRPGVDFFVNFDVRFGSVLMINSVDAEGYVAAVQHVRRRETIAMTPVDCLAALGSLAGEPLREEDKDNNGENKAAVLNALKEITGTGTKAVLGSSGLSVQYAIMMGLIDDALKNHAGKAIKFVVPPNCYGGTNDQARRVAASVANVEVVDLPVDDGDDMVTSVDRVLDDIAADDAVPYIIAEIPTNPRVEVPNLERLRDALSKKRNGPGGKPAIDPVFILDQTFCPNVRFLGVGEILSTVRTIAYVSGSKFPSGGLCTAGYCVANDLAATLLVKVGRHLDLCANEATGHQLEVLARQLPSMNRRIAAAYQNTRVFVDFIAATLPSAKINFVSEELALRGFTPSVFSLDLPAKGKSEEERERNKRALNRKLINLMITEIPHQSKFCVSYGQLEGCYWTIPATSTQGTTKEGDKDYIVRASLSPEMDVEAHKKGFLKFVKAI